MANQSIFQILEFPNYIQILSKIKLKSKRIQVTAIFKWFIRVKVKPNVIYGMFRFTTLSHELSFLLSLRL